jgi:hypothetical protein
MGDQVLGACRCGFEIHCGKNLEAEIRFQVPRAEGGVAYGVVMKLLASLEERGHCVVMDNYFSSMPSSEIWRQRGFMRLARLDLTG